MDDFQAARQDVGGRTANIGILVNRRTQNGADLPVCYVNHGAVVRIMMRIAISKTRPIFRDRVFYA